MNLQDIAARVQRLDKLSRGLAKEEVTVRHCHDALLYRERQDYLKATLERERRRREVWENMARILREREEKRKSERPKTGRSGCH